MKHLLILVIILFALIPAQVQGLNYLTLMKAYSQQDILDNYNLCDVTFNGKVVEIISPSNEKIRLEFYNSFDYQEKNNLKRILYTDVTASYAKALYDYYNFGKPSGGFEEENIHSENTFGSSTLKERNYIRYYFDRYKQGDKIEVSFIVMCSGYKGGKLDGVVSLDVNYSQSKMGWIKPRSNSEQGIKYDGDSGWKIIRKY